MNQRTWVRVWALGVLLAGSGAGVASAETTPELPREAPREVDPESMRVATEGQEGTPRAFADWAASAAGDSPGSGGGPSPDRAWQALLQAETAGTPRSSWPQLELRGTFRARANRWWHRSLGTEGTSPYLPPLESVLVPDRSEGSLPSFEPDPAAAESFSRAWNRGRTGAYDGDLRLRLYPMIHVSESLIVHTEFDLLDGVRLGEGTESRGVAASAVGDASETVRVRQAFGEVHSSIGRFRMGRAARHWGLGILHHGGGSWSPIQEPRASDRGGALRGHDCWDCDGGTITDRLEWQLRLPSSGTRVARTVGTGVEVRDAGSSLPLRGPMGSERRHGFGDGDTAYGFFLHIAQRPTTASEAGLINRQLREARGSVLDWGVQLSTERRMLQPRPSSLGGVEWVPRDMTLWMPDLWMRWRTSPGPGQLLRLELQAVGVLGEVGFGAANSNVSGLRERDRRAVRQIGVAGELEYRHNALQTGLHAGYASGRSLSDASGPGFGLLDRTLQLNEDERLTAFVFHPNYRVDRLMFRELVGGVTNAIYASTFLTYDFLSRLEDSLGLRLDLLAAGAPNAEATPSGESFYGVELGSSVFFETESYRFEVLGALLVPGSSFAARANRPRNPVYVDSLGLPNTFASNRAARATGMGELRFLWAF